MASRPRGATLGSPCRLRIAQTTLRTTLGQHELDDLLANQAAINELLKQIIDTSTEPWRPGRSADRELPLRGFERVSPESRYRRFLAAMPELSEEMVRYLTDVDHHDHEAIIALDEETGEGVSVARYVRYKDRPDVAEAAVTVIDAWQGRGLGTLLLEVLSARARQEGIRSFTALMLATNEEMMDLLRRLDPTVHVVHRESGTVEIEVPIPEVGLAPALKKLLAISARADVAVPLGARDGTARRALSSSS